MSEIYWVSHSRLLREVSISGWLVNVGPLRVGSGREAPLGSSVDLAVIRIRIGDKSVPYIPGSSLKGVYRTVATQLAKSKGLSVCSGPAKETCMDWEIPQHGGATLQQLVQEQLNSREYLQAVRYFYDYACLMCKIFGAPSYTGNVVFEDAYPINEKGEVMEVRTGIRTGIAINRRTGSVHERSLYQVEYVEPGARFRFKMRATNLPNYALGLLAKAIRMMNDGWVKVGGFKTRGFGEVRLEGLEFFAWGPTVSGTKLLAVKYPEKEPDKEVDLTGVAEARNGGIYASGEKAWKVFEKLEEVWDSAKFG
jgi:CRISPR-associated RAMP protein (TIGR02581 family)